MGLPVMKEKSSDPTRSSSTTSSTSQRKRPLACLSSSHAIKTKISPPHPIMLEARMLTASNRGARLHHSAAEVEMIGNCGRIHMRKRIREYRHV
jgi:hypothetical protein